MGKQDLFSCCFPRSATMHCENEALKLAPLHMHFNAEMLLWSTACLWCIINIFPLFGSSHNHRLCRLMGKKTLQFTVTFLSCLMWCLESYAFTVDYLPHLRRHLVLERVSRQRRGWKRSAWIRMSWLNWLRLRLYSQTPVRLQAASPLGSRASVANQCHDLREMSLSSH